MKTRKIICLYGGAGSGKSTVCAGLYYRLKLQDYNCEMNREYIENWIWNYRPVAEGDQKYFFAKQAQKERDYINNNLDFIITDSPLILTHFYGLLFDPMEQECNTSKIMLAHHHKFCQKYNYKVDHFFINRTKPYNPAGRFQTAEEAKAIDGQVKNMLDEFGINYSTIDGDDEAVQKILKILAKDK